MGPHRARLGEHPDPFAASEVTRRAGVVLRGASTALRAALLALLGCTLPVAAADDTSERSATDQPGQRILGGQQAAAGKWPWSVALLDVLGDPGSRQHYCGGSVIAPRWVLTAAHCVDGGTEEDEIQVLVGSNDLEDRSARRIDVRSIHLHEGYSYDGYENDIALLELSRAAGVPAIAIPDRARSARLGAPGTEATVVGWGLLRDVSLACEPGSNPRGSACTMLGGATGYYVDEKTGEPLRISDVLPTRLMEVELPVVHEQTCRDAYPGMPIDDRTLCAGYLEGGKDSCSADSGGPLMVSDGDAWVQTGVVSWGRGCAQPGNYGVYTKVAAFAPWIEARTGLALASGGEAPSVPETTTTEPLVDEPDEEVVVAQSAEPTPPAPATPAAVGGRALIIGINVYSDARVQDLRGAVRDAHNVRRLLVEHLGFRPQDIRMLLDAEATGDAIRREIRRWLVDGTRPGERALLYYAGHGYYQIDQDGDEADGFDEVLVPHDARIVSGEPRPMQVANLIRDDEVGAMLDELEDRQVFLIVDSCHSGTMTRSAAPAAGDQRYVRTLLSEDAREFGRRALPSEFTESTRSSRQRDLGFIDSRDNLVAWTAVSPLQLALEDRESAEPEGVFTGRFVRGIAQRLADRDGDGRVIYSELLDYLQAESTAYCRRHPRHCEAGMTPTLQASRELLVADVTSGIVIAEDTASVASGALGHSNMAEVRLEILPSPQLRFGQTVSYRVSSSRSGHLLIVNVSPDGEVSTLFPNPYSDQAGQGTEIAAGRTVEIPNAFYGFEIEVGPPAGSGYLVAIVTEDPIPLDDLLDQYRDSSPVPDAREWLLTLGERLRDLWLEETGTRTVLWSADAVEYEVRP